MSFDAHKNFAASLVAVAPSPASSGTTLSFTAGEGGKFPTPPFNLTIQPATGQPSTANAEIVRVTAMSGDNVTAMLRGQEGSSARTVLVGDQVYLAPTAKWFTDLETAPAPAHAGSHAPGGSDPLTTADLPVSVAKESQGGPSGPLVTAGGSPLVNVGDFVAATLYPAGFVILHSGSFRAAKVQFTSGASYSATDWNTIASSASVPIPQATPVTASGTLTAGYQTSHDCTTGAQTQALPTGLGAGAVVAVSKDDISANALTVTGNIRGVAGQSISLLGYRELIGFITDATGSWWPAWDHKTKAYLDSLYVALGAATAKGDILAANAAPSLVRVGVGADGSTLVADASQTVGLRWSQPLRSSAFRGAVPIANRAELPDAAGVSNGVDLGATYRTAHVLAADATAIRLVFFNGFGEANGANAITVTASIEPPGYSTLQVTFNGLSSAVIAPGATFVSDPISVLDPLIAGSTLFVRCFVSVASTGMTWPTTIFALLPGEGNNRSAILAAPVQNALATATTGGTIPASTTEFVVMTALSAAGETIASNEQTITTGAGTNTSTVTATCPPVAGAASYRAYFGSSSGTENHYFSSTTPSVVITGAVGTAGTPPGTSTAKPTDLTLAAWTPATVTTDRMFGPVAVLGNASNPSRRLSPIIGFIGDSVIRGGQDRDNSGWALRAIRAQAGTLLKPLAGYVQLGVGGSRAAGWWTTTAFGRAALIEDFTHVICNFLTNEINNGQTLASCQADMLRLWGAIAARGPKVFHTTMQPNDNLLSGPAAIRAAFNDWLRGGAPVTIGSLTHYVVGSAPQSGDPATLPLTPVAVGTVGALLAGQPGHPLTDYFELADLVETARNSNVWIAAARGTDGVHPSTLGNIMMTPGITRSKLGIALPTAPALNPSAISGLIADYDPSVSPPADGTSLATIPDQSSGGIGAATQAGAAGIRPVYKSGIVNGQGVFRFAGASAQYVNLPSLAALTAGTVIAVIKTVVDPSVGSKYALWGLGPNGTYYPYTDGKLYEGFGTTTQKVTNAETLIPLNTWNVYCVTSQANDWKNYQNGGLISFANAGTGGSTVAFPASPTIGCLPAQLGGAYFDGDMARFLMWNRVLTDAELQTVVRGLGARFAIDVA